MRAFLCGVLLFAGCVATGEAEVKPTSSGAIASAPEPEPRLCLNDGACPAGVCVKAADSVQGVCSQVAKTPACRATKDCPVAHYCYRPVGFNGICFKP